ERLLTGASENGPRPSPLPPVTITPAATGMQLVRFSLPVPDGALTNGSGLDAVQDRNTFPVGLRPLTWHGTNSRFVRRALVTFPFRFPDQRPVRFEFRAAAAATAGATASVPRIRIEGETLLVNGVDGPSV